MHSVTHWFKRKSYGWGWTPVTWQGWLVVGLYLVVVIVGALSLRGASGETLNREFGFYILLLLLATISLIRISHLKGPKPEWRWGSKDDDKSDEDM